MPSKIEIWAVGPGVSGGERAMAAEMKGQPGAILIKPLQVMAGRYSSWTPTGESGYIPAIAIGS